MLPCETAAGLLSGFVSAFWGCACMSDSYIKKHWLHTLFNVVGAGQKALPLFIVASKWLCCSISLAKRVAFVSTAQASAVLAVHC